MSITGVIHGNRIDLDETPPFAEGTRVTVNVEPAISPRRGSPAAVMKLAGTLTHEEAETIRSVARVFRQVDEKLWELGT